MNICVAVIFSCVLARVKQVVSNSSDSRVHSVYGGDTDVESLLYPAIEPFATGRLPVSQIHTIYYEQSGNPNGLPIVALHGGPGSGIFPRDQRFFDPKAYHAVLFDQRGAGKSTPAFSLEENDTWALVEDMEKLRRHLGIERWVVFGGSWGSTLALAYAETYPDRVIALVLRGIFTVRQKEIKWFYQEGASNIFPDAWDAFLAPIPEEERSDMLTAYHKRLTGPNEEERLRCARAWSLWEMTTCQLRVNPKNLKRVENDNWALAFALIECHYFMNKGFQRSEEQFIEDAVILEQKKIPVTIVQGRYDVVCPATTAWDLYKKIPSADFYFVEDAGHCSQEVGTTIYLLQACNKYKMLQP